MAYKLCQLKKKRTRRNFPGGRWGRTFCRENILGKGAEACVMGKVGPASTPAPRPAQGDRGGV